MGNWNEKTLQNVDQLQLEKSKNYGQSFCKDERSRQGTLRSGSNMSNIQMEQTENDTEFCVPNKR